MYNKQISIMIIYLQGFSIRRHDENQNGQETSLDCSKGG